jgi:hypothetical protein
LEAYEPAYSGIDVTKLREQSAELLTALQQAGAENVVDFVEQMQQDDDASRLPKIVRVEA